MNARDIINALIEARTNSEVSEIYFNNLDVFETNRHLFRQMLSARIRINNLGRTKIALTELIYLN